MPTESDETGPRDRKRHSRRPDRAIAAIAERQEGVVSLEQLIATGLSEDEIRHRVRLGWLRPIHRRVFAVGYLPVTRKGKWWAALLAIGDDAVLSHSTAAAVWGILPEVDQDIHVTVPELQRRRHDGVEPHRNRLGRDELTAHLGLPVTTPIRTLLDLAITNPEHLERAIRQAEYNHLTSAAALAAAVAEVRGRRGIQKLREALAKVTETPGITRSKLEQRFVEFLRRYSLPRPKLNVAMKIGGKDIVVDALWLEQRVIVELDGRAAHATAAAFESDRARDAALVAAGYRVVRITWRRLHDDGALVAGELRKILAESDETGARDRKRHSRRAA